MEWINPEPWTQPTLLVLKVNGWEVARVGDRVGGDTWLSTVNRHVRDWRKHLRIITPSRSLAIRCAERYTRAHLARILTELPEMRAGPCGATLWYPPTNPDPMSDYLKR